MLASAARWWCGGARPRAGAVRRRGPGSANRGRAPSRQHQERRPGSPGGDQELLHDIPQEYVVDQQRGISDPVGMTGTRLEVEMYLVTVQSTAAQNLRRSVERARYRPAELVLEPLAASYAVLTDDEKELGVALVEVGGGSTGVAVFHEGKIRHLASLKYAGTHVTSDLVAGMVELARGAFAVPVRAGAAEQGISGLGDSVQAPRYAVPVGLVLYAARRLAQGGVPSGSLVKSAGVERWFGPLKRWLQDFF